MTKQWIAFSDRVEEITENSETPRIVAIAPSSAYMPNIALGAARVAADMRLASLAPELLAVLRIVEWIQDDLVLEPRCYCPCCDAQEKNGHYDSCQLGQALARARAD